MATAIIIYSIVSIVALIVTFIDSLKWKIYNYIENKIGLIPLHILTFVLMPYIWILIFLDWNFNGSETNKEIERMQKENESLTFKTK